ncbi:hypothetical protein SBA1_1310013 [Candidatus Sulfotelmatobacter kueseliae]|uniref:Uncharacterized protein n=1 Tax=Candidatus Sulfotelmatobacter kueseliae TaxID=2042962 RepID=A0A2U3K4K5_9BACT|nr:hypothetical protein SBA1_1310013 [Candidatus Sulfotelmatobacter kueseliae]
MIQLTPARDDDHNARSATLPESKEIEGNHGVGNRGPAQLGVTPITFRRDRIYGGSELSLAS